MIPRECQGNPGRWMCRWQDIRPSHLVFCSLQLNLNIYERRTILFVCRRFDILDYRDVFYHMHMGLFFFLFFGLWKSIEESNLCVNVLQLHVIWTIWNHSLLVEVRRLMPYIIHQVWRCEICCLSNLRALEIWCTRLQRCFPPHAHGSLFLWPSERKRGIKP